MRWQKKTKIKAEREKKKSIIEPSERGQGSTGSLTNRRSGRTLELRGRGRGGGGG